MVDVRLADVLETRSGRFELTCARCGTVADDPSVKRVYCECGGIYDIRYFDSSDAASGLPLANPDSMVDLGQGNTR